MTKIILLDQLSDSDDETVTSSDDQNYADNNSEAKYNIPINLTPNAQWTPYSDFEDQRKFNAPFLTYCQSVNRAREYENRLRRGVVETKFIKITENNVNLRQEISVLFWLYYVFALMI